MKKILISCVGVIGLLFVFCGTKPAPAEDDKVKTEEVIVKAPIANCTPDMKPFVVMEMFTYEGCHSCAEAEKVFNSLILSVRQNTKQPNIIAISEHIAYWNHLEWPDKYGLDIYDSIQTQYCKMQNSQQYTPQLVINGQLIGVPDPKFMQNNISYFLNQKPVAGVCIEKKNIQDTTIVIAYNLLGSTKGCALVCMLIESDIQNKVEAGDNAGMILHHENVGRAYKTVVLTDTSGEFKLHFPSDVVLENSSVIAYVKNSKSLKIVAATTGFEL